MGAQGYIVSVPESAGKPVINTLQIVANLANASEATPVTVRVNKRPNGPVTLLVPGVSEVTGTAAVLHALWQLAVSHKAGFSCTPFIPVHTGTTQSVTGEDAGAVNAAALAKMGDVGSVIGLVLGASGYGVGGAACCLTAPDVTSVELVTSEMSAVVAELDAYLYARAYIVGAELSLADVLVFCTLFHSAWWTSVQKQWAALSRWFKHIALLPYVREVAQLVSIDTAKVETTAGGRVKKVTTGSLDISLPGAVEGQVVTRFPPEPSGYMHVGHVKAAMLNSFYATHFKGKLVVRFDDTNPSNESEEFVDAILDSLKQLDITPSIVTHTSDSFEIILSYCEMLLKDGRAYVDDTPIEEMRELRRAAKVSACRSRTVEENWALWEEMKLGSEAGQACVVRIKCDPAHKNAVMRDPSIFRVNLTPHLRTGTKYKVYPMYDFACPIVDSIEGVTHALRTIEYRDRDEQYHFMIEQLGLRQPYIWEYSRLSFKYTLLSKRKLQQIVDTGKVLGWDDPRFPTVMGILRRGMTVEALRTFILAQGASKSDTLQSWNKVWALNKAVVDKKCKRHSALPFTSDKGATNTGVALIALDGPGVPDGYELRDIVANQSEPSLGTLPMWFGNKVMIPQAGAKTLAVGDQFLLLNWGVFVVKAIDKEETGEDPNVLSIAATAVPDAKPPKKGLKSVWLSSIAPFPGASSGAAADAACQPLQLITVGDLITKEKPGPNDTIGDLFNEGSWSSETMYGGISLKDVTPGTSLQIMGRGNFIVDKDLTEKAAVDEKTGLKPLVMLNIPSGSGQR